ncbi:hypothetical protein Amsp01_051470 [Amycolatopsis sp. NBRC 101858]|uniref:hypothetical protein n=1 Tax=Amycolatopsis sp. NBRC 101858 TaxID=3032200 RepID=UPI0024A3E5AE|nr:hypothetical protein [Amycolatopsis sp. NBRC 101858]GLY39123.1 hypothetical protein Amsp01_051470 [Amycolatopsis sp. NBRC 101858]
MGRGSRSWFPLALLGIAQVAMAAVQLLSRRSAAEGESANLLLGPPSAGAPEYSRAQWLSQDAFYSLGRGLPTGLLWLGALGVVLVGTAVWYAVVRRSVRTGWFVLGTLGALVAVPLLDLVGSWQFRLGDGVRGPLLATLGLLVLAAYERSRLVLLTAFVFAVIAVVLSADIVGVLLSAAVLLAAAFAVLLRRAPDTLP